MMVRSSLTRWLPLMRDEAPRMTKAERRELARMWDSIGYVLLPKEDLPNMDLDAALTLQRRYLERRA